MIHGYQELGFVHLGIPHERHSQGYIYRTVNLLNTPHEAAGPHVPPENMDIDAVMDLKEEINKLRKDNGQ
jgi:hypothetical protein